MRKLHVIKLFSMLHEKILYFLLRPVYSPVPINNSLTYIKALCWVPSTTKRLKRENCSMKWVFCVDQNDFLKEYS